MRELSLRCLSAGYGGRAAIREVSLKLREGEILSLIGPNGAGKTTLLRALARQLRPLAGTVLLDGADLWELDGVAAAQKLALLGTERPRGERVTAADAVRLGRQPYTGRLGILSKADEAAAAAAMERVGVTALAERELDTLSDGQRQRVLLARALCQEPEVLVLDEPTSFLDVRYQAELLSLLRELADREGLSVVLSLHDPELARRASDRVLCVRDGRAERIGAPAEVLDDTYLENLYDMESGSWAAYFGRQPAGERDFFQNRGCESFPCHRGVEEKAFNCLFCYCPLYTLGERCGGNFHYTEKGVKSCVDCNFPHKRENYRAVLARYPELSALAGKQAEPERYVRSGQRYLRRGWTTGTCAALAAAGAARYLLTGEPPESESLQTPKGLTAHAELLDQFCDGVSARCAVRKDAGDDPDVTDGCLIVAEARKTEGGAIGIDGGEGVGRVTRPGLDQPVGAAAINTVPRRMIADAVRAVRTETGYAGGLLVTVSVPGGADIAKRTFNPLLGVEGGVSILGTSGVVEPMSDRAVADTVEAELRQRKAEGESRVVLTPGNYGADFLRKSGLIPENIRAVKYSNFLGEAIDSAVLLGFREILLAGHAGKLVKLAGGVMNTHSRVADCRAELFAAHAALCGADAALCRRLMDAATTESMIDLLQEAGLSDAVLRSLLAAMQRQLDRRCGEGARSGAVLFTNRHGLLGMTDPARALLERWNGRKE